MFGGKRGRFSSIHIYATTPSGFVPVGYILNLFDYKIFIFNKELNTLINK